MEKDSEDGSICYCKSGVGAMIWTIAVLPDYRRFRIASQLILKAVDWARSKDIDFIEAWTRDDKWVLNWYESVGFSRFHSYWHIYFKGNNAKSLFRSNDKDIALQSVFAHSDKNPKTLDQNKIDRFHAKGGELKGWKRWLAGAADQMTGGFFDFDKNGLSIYQASGQLQKAGEIIEAVKQTMTEQKAEKLSQPTVTNINDSNPAVVVGDEGDDMPILIPGRDELDADKYIKPKYGLIAEFLTDPVEFM